MLDMLGEIFFLMDTALALESVGKTSVLTENALEF